MAEGKISTRIRVRYSETDQMGTFYNSRALEWFECGRTELLRASGVPYRDMESRGLMLPIVESHVEYLGRAQYDDELVIFTAVRMGGRARVRFDVAILQADTHQPVSRGWTVHAITSLEGKAVRPPQWFLAAIQRAGQL